MTRFTVLAAESSVSTQMRSSVHKLHAESRELTGSIEGELDPDGAPRFEAAHGARLEVPGREHALRKQAAGLGDAAAPRSAALPGNRGGG